jgi:hypothetical protein
MDTIEILDAIRQDGFDVEVFSLRVAGRIMVWFPSGKWQDLHTGHKGQCENWRLMPMVVRNLLDPDRAIHDHTCQQCSKVLKHDCDCLVPLKMEWCSARCRKAFDL